jgi:hypothetical protein
VAIIRSSAAISKWTYITSSTRAPPFFKLDSRTTVPFFHKRKNTDTFIYKLCNNFNLLSFLHQSRLFQGNTTYTPFKSGRMTS